jgi:biopolymer transport protein ExbD
MRSRIMMLPLALFLCATAAFANETTAVNIPFSFESHGKLFPASQYVVSLTDDRRHISITDREAPVRRVVLQVNPAEIKPQDPTLSIKFDNAGGSHSLQSVRLGSYQYKR